MDRIENASEYTQAEVEDAVREIITGKHGSVVQSLLLGIADSLYLPPPLDDKT